ncbi:methylenetetrahydrofolate reductase [NAD(P)H] [Campylobacter hepaticus]|uniref:methylenetetrahydrofolate reductase [NAD(P)H] n=1 Tax=Campylobacter hepaticus TaxID=1813019 RepID=UPI0018CAAC43|nr:methylenetetrahydrofolate reductase [NAD(P)H] [Campylobacter hepaticus]MCZ0772149.1 methylenetetrahydrofolate reductase [NAD(P)H] [Campylobacter hepaticus]MCZ0773618.1 methylenetetrahydrofolate reductase [NAD(P)H] [Campylobacter hepaticus]MCZ0774868.1 methylenetetrahydrofolate reductase [NAD(P)H] [Campylobacter hepaticus]QPM44150.1 methylenetetrahydrofolate reductase [NAD(P)H] [Campylobacter hepaticus]WAP49058.1 methylenetetrahydrofolate reductase [NAD(P)H] [Campylobacter hepaticus]
MCSFSFEIFPPRKDENIKNLDAILDDLGQLSPNFISVTFGAGRSINSKNTLETASLIQEKYKIPSIVHLPCIHSSKEKITQILQQCKDRQLNKILALRGDVCNNLEKSKDFSYASDLISFIQKYKDFEIYAACYPEKHNESKNFIEDIHYLKNKVDLGTNKLITQLFYDNDFFYTFKQNCALANINIPIYAGIMPITNKRQVLKITQLCGSKIPAKFTKILEKYENNALALEDAGIAYAIDQIIDLITSGVDGIHLYTMNKSRAAIKIYEAIKYLIKVS